MEMKEILKQIDKMTEEELKDRVKIALRCIDSNIKDAQQLIDEYKEERNGMLELSQRERKSTLNSAFYFITEHFYDEIEEEKIKKNQIHVRRI